MTNIVKKLLATSFLIFVTAWPMSSWNPIQLTNTYCGSKSFGDEHLGEIVVNGATELDETTIEHLTVNGSLEARNATIGTLIVNGSAYLEDSKVERNTTINGGLETSGATLHKISILSSEIILCNSTATDIVIHKARPSKVQRLKLRKGTQITGSVTFESGKGEVWISDDSSVKGQIKGATTLRK